jgi:hypothetical protein
VWTKIADETLDTLAAYGRRINNSRDANACPVPRLIRHITVEGTRSV